LTDVQISGGDPTLRDHDELEELVRYIGSKGLRSSLFTNGILASRALLQRLAQAGLSDVAFHVDMTQERKGYDSEGALNSLRQEYIERARGLGLAVFFNTTIFEANVHDVPMLARFFAQHSDVIQLASFQLQAETGRGVLGPRPAQLTQQRMIDLIQQGLGTSLNWDALLGGHSSCNRYCTAVVLGAGQPSPAHVQDLFFDGDFIARVMRETAHLAVPRSIWQALNTWVRAVVVRPALLVRGMRFTAQLLARTVPHAFRLRSLRVSKISFFLHNFMDASALDRERLDCCIFMAAAADGFVPMCEYNARRDEYILRPVNGQSSVLRLDTAVRADHDGLVRYPVKFLKGRSRQQALRERQQARTAERHNAHSSRKSPHDT
jgi:7,8-dihydro-6-hydroxymethylpterin dimethyltransferase